jgi:hypothetical protein
MVRGSFHLLLLETFSTLVRSICFRHENLLILS